ncbi:hypothetical protein HELRODRAFT_185083 [Helobdella robusta]|uniref:F-box domain-containing protein n=1 Tax=Helobdella robusta TaxID=6412 RepID=T1FMD6_HELRO|nr:hypothetical protein HELRODRAFT_185083 [Helobdella robusta]ESN96439.1 hypothetical protein HELRODRAFT_185083 [Helobdella robusta]
MAKLAKSKSTWTPLSNPELNQKIFNERRLLTNKWFEKWSDDQKLQIIDDFVSQMKSKHLDALRELLANKKNFFHEDFTRCLPRILSVYIFSFLDPRSLSRCAQVCWHWKWITELDQLWMKKCLSFGWLIPPSKNLQENAGLWKKHYIENISALKTTIQLATLKMSARSPRIKRPSSALNTNRSTTSTSALTTKRDLKNSRPPWRGSDKAPRDIRRNNYLNNEDEVEKFNRMFVFFSLCSLLVCFFFCFNLV